MSLSAILHLITAGIVIFVGILLTMAWLYWIGAFLFIIMLFYQHLIIKPNDLLRLNAAFFITNGIASVVFAVFTILDEILF
jgi:4-hydroxybenzoate polyprenyltransferase